MGPDMAMTRGARRAILPLLAALSLTALAACGMMGKPGQRVDLNSVSREKIPAFGTPIMRASVPARGVDVLLSIREQKGNVVTWEAAGGYTFTFRDDVLIETRGLGPDLMSASAPSSGNIAAGTVAAHSYYFLGDNDATERRNYTCAPQTVGPEALTVYSRIHKARQVTELCTRPEGKVTNQFWFEGAIIRQSLQWISPAAGYAVWAGSRHKFK